MMFCYLEEELLVAGPPLPSRLASPGPASAPRPARNKWQWSEGERRGLENAFLRMELLTQSSQAGRPDQLHQLVVGHVAQQVLQATLAAEG